MTSLSDAVKLLLAMPTIRVLLAIREVRELGHAEDGWVLYEDAEEHSELDFDTADFWHCNFCQVDCGTMMGDPLGPDYETLPMAKIEPEGEALLFILDTLKEAP